MVIPHFVPTVLSRVQECEQSAKPLQVADQMLHWMGLQGDQSGGPRTEAENCQLSLALATDILFQGYRAVRVGDRPMLRLGVALLNRLPAFAGELEAVVGSVKRLDW